MIPKTTFLLILTLFFSCSLWKYNDPSKPLENQTPETYLSLLASDTLYQSFSGRDTIWAIIDSVQFDTVTQTYDTTWTYLTEGSPDSNAVWIPVGDAFETVTTSRQELHWWGEDPDGNVLGYFYRWNIDTSWTYTNDESALFYVPIQTQLNVFSFSVKSIDNSAVWEYEKPAKSGIDNEFFSDVGYIAQIYDSLDVLLSEGITPGIQTEMGSALVFLTGNELFVLPPTDTTGAVDPTPAKIVLPIQNSAPTISFRYRSNPLSVDLPNDTSFTFPTRTFIWDVEDQDGIETVTDIYYALDDTCDTCWNQLDAASYSSITLTEISPGFHTFFLKAKDIAGAESEMIQFPDTTDQNTVNYWKVKPVIGKVLLVDDYPYDKNNNTQYWYKTILDSILGPENYSTWEIGEELPYSAADINANLNYFDHVIWYSAYYGSETYDEASSSILNYIMNGGNIFLNIPDLKDTSFIWFPIDSTFTLNKSGRLLRGRKLHSQIDSSLDLEVSKLIPIRLKGFETDPETHPYFFSLYRLQEPTGPDEWVGTPNVCAKYQFEAGVQLSGKVVLMTIPLHDGSQPILEGNGSASKFIAYLLEEEFTTP